MTTEQSQPSIYERTFWVWVEAAQIVLKNIAEQAKLDVAGDRLLAAILEPIFLWYHLTDFELDSVVPQHRASRMNELMHVGIGFFAEAMRNRLEDPERTFRDLYDARRAEYSEFDVETGEDWGHIPYTFAWHLAQVIAPDDPEGFLDVFGAAAAQMAIEVQAMQRDALAKMGLFDP